MNDHVTITYVNMSRTAVHPSLAPVALETAAFQDAQIVQSSLIAKLSACALSVSSLSGSLDLAIIVRRTVSAIKTRTKKGGQWSKENSSSGYSWPAKKKQKSWGFPTPDPLTTPRPSLPSSCHHCHLPGKTDRKWHHFLWAKSSPLDRQKPGKGMKRIEKEHG